MAHIKSSTLTFKVISTVYRTKIHPALVEIRCRCLSGGRVYFKKTALPYFNKFTSLMFAFSFFVKMHICAL